MKAHAVITSLLCAIVMSPALLAQHTPERLLYRRTDNIPAADFTGALPDNVDQEAPFGELDDPDSSLISALNVDREPGTAEIDLTGDNHDLAFIFQFYDADGVFSFTENYDDRVKVVATPIAGPTDLNASGGPQEHTDVSWNQRTFANFDFAEGGWFNVDIWLTEDGGGAQSAADIGFGYYNDFSSNTGDFGGIGYVGTFGISSGAPAEFDTDPTGRSWGAYVDSFDPDLDTDGDSIPDGYEEQFFPGDLTQLGLGDFDGDGINDPDEYTDGTDPTEADADGDGSNDGAEKAAGTNPFDPDSDNDGLLDGVESLTGTFVDANDTGTDPLDPDTDGDGATDGFEVTENTDPNDANSLPDTPTIQPSFVPINEIAPGAYGPDLANAGVNYQENHYGGGVIFNNQAQGNYNAHVSGNPAPLRSFDAIEPLTSHGNGGNQISNLNRPWLDGGGENFTVRYNGYLDMSTFSPGTYNIHLGADDTNYFIMDTADGQVTAQHNCCPQNQVTSFTITIPGFFPFDNVFGEQSGGDWADVGISGPGINGIVAIGDTAAGSPPVYPIGASPTDDDNDGLLDAWETLWDDINDLTQLSGDGDFDNDGSTDLEEFTANTDPTDSDSDDDGLSDGAEATAGTDPLNEDSDGDGLVDGVETGTGAFVNSDDTGTDALDPDSDGDAVSDGSEILFGTDPTDPASKPGGIAELNTLSILTTGNYVFLAGGESVNAYVENDGTDSWLLVGRGREGWNWNAAGQGSSSEVSQGLGTPDAFSPAAYSTNFINDLISASDSDLLGVEIRIKRASNPEGSAYEEARWRPTGEAAWRWNFDTGMSVEYEVVETNGVQGGQLGIRNVNTRDGELGGNDGDRIFTWNWGNHGVSGFSFGSAVSNGSNNSTSFLWENGDENHAIPYSEIYIRLKNPGDVSGEDSDGDGIVDIIETSLVGNLDDLSAGDDDADGLSTPDEILIHSTDPLVADTDEDGVPDGDEITNGTNPLNSDSDGDGLLDGVETGTGIFVDTNDTGSDPLDVDTDGDGVTDGFEVDENTDPNDANSKPAVVTVQPSFVPINELAPGAYGPDFANPGVNYQENHYGGGVIFNNNAQNNYDVHTSGDPVPTRSFDAIEPLTSHGGGGNAISTRNRPWLDGGGENFTVRYNGYLDMSTFAPGTYNIHLGADDTNYFIMDTADGQVTAQHNCCPQNQTTPFTINVPGIFPFDNVFGEQSGGDWADVGISGPGINGIVAIGDTDAGSPPVYAIGVETTDDDGDDLPDAWETSWDAINDLTQLSGDGDFDNDGVTDLEELNAGLNPTSDDSDDDGASDGDEIANETDPRNADTDGDGLADGAETNTGVFIDANDTGTDPLNTDSDNDLISDFDEANNPNRDPNVPEEPQAGDLTADLTVYYNFDENLLDQAHLIDGSASTAADDLEFISPHPGTYDEGLFGGGGYFGPGQGGGHAETPFSPDIDGDIAGPSQEITVQWWGRVDAFTTSWQIGVGRGEGANWRFHRWGANPTMAWQGGSNDIHANAADFPIDDGEWHHFVGTSNGVANVRALYIDGVEAVSTTLSGALASDPGLPLMIGENPGARNRQWNGGIDDVAIWRRALTTEQIQAIYLAGTKGQSLGDLIGGPGLDPLGLEVILADANGPGNIPWIRAEFNTQPARQYDILVSPDLNSPRESWTELEGFQDIPADPSGRASVDFPAPYDGTGFLAIREEGLPAFFEDDFESGAGDWVAVVNDASSNTLWELGTPSGSTGPITGAEDSNNAWSTNLGDYGPDSDISLFSPALDFSGLPGAELTFEAFRDADGFADTATVLFRRVGDDVQLGAATAMDMTIFDTDYTSISIPVPAEVIGENARIEFNFVSDGSPDAFSGFTIDNVKVEAAAP